jgi:hypothetical protein
MLKYHGKLNDNNFLTAYFSALSSKWNASGQIPDRAVEDGTIGWFGAIDANEGGKTSRYNFNANLKSYLKNGGKFTNQIFFFISLFVGLIIFMMRSKFFSNSSNLMEGVISKF